MVEVEAGRGRGVEQPGLGKAQLEVEFSLAELGLDIGRLAPPHDVGPAYLDESGQAVHRPIGGADLELADAFFLDLEDEVDVAQGVGRLVVQLDVLEEAQGEDLPLAAHHQGAAEQVTGDDLQLAADDLVPGLGVALDDDPVDVGLLVLGDRVLDVDGGVVQVLGWQDVAVDVAVLGVDGVQILQRLVGVVRPVDLAGLQHRDPGQARGDELIVALE